MFAWKRNGKQSDSRAQLADMCTQCLRQEKKDMAVGEKGEMRKQNELN